MTQETLKPELTPEEWRQLEVRYRGQLAKYEAIQPLGDRMDHRFAGPGATAEVTRALRELCELEEIIMWSPAPDLHALRLKVAVYEPDMHGAETIWETLQQELLSRLSDAGAALEVSSQDRPQA